MTGVTERASKRLRYGVCDCEYPCSCCELDGVGYGSWKDVMDALDAQIEELRAAMISARDYTTAIYALANMPEHMERGRVNYGRIRSKLRCIDEILATALQEKETA